MAALPILVWRGVAHGTTRLGGYVVLMGLLLGIPFLVRDQKDRDRAAPLDSFGLPFLVATLAVASIWSGDHRFLLATPALVNGALLVTFGLSLGAERTPAIERFARAMRGSLTRGRVAYCRQVTIAWTCFFALNGLLCAWAALGAPLSFWAIYTGGISYFLVGLMFCIEYVVRRVRFG